MSGLLPGYTNSLLIPVKRKCFISYYGANRVEADAFLRDFGSAMVARAIGVTDGADFISSANAEYVMSRIRQDYLGDSTVTILLLGACTHSRRYIDWEIKASLRQGNYTPNGLLGLLLPSAIGGAHLPERFSANWSSDETQCFAIYRWYPSSKDQLSGYIEEAFARRDSHARLIKNSQEMFKYNHVCNVHDVTH